MDNYTTRTDLVGDGETVDMGYHYAPEHHFADLDLDGDADSADFATLARAWLTEPTDARWNRACDIAFPADNRIDALDLATLADYWLMRTQ
jgi:hypothetical protein